MNSNKPQEVFYYNNVTYKYWANRNTLKNRDWPTNQEGYVEYEITESCEYIYILTWDVDGISENISKNPDVPKMHKGEKQMVRVNLSRVTEDLIK